VTVPAAPDPGIIVHELAVPRTARVATLGGRNADEVWLVLHGYGQLASQFLHSFLPAARPGRLIVAPEALSRFYTTRKPDRVGATWMTREARDAEIQDYLGYLDLVAGRFAPEATRVEVHGPPSPSSVASPRPLPRLADAVAECRHLTAPSPSRPRPPPQRLHRASPTPPSRRRP
jgi:hypothetical protein